MRVIRKEPGKFPEVVDIPNELEDLQKAVGGYIETWPVTTDFTIICDGEGKIKGKLYNCTLCGKDFVGTILFVGVNEEGFTDVNEDFCRLFRGLWET